MPEIKFQNKEIHYSVAGDGPAVMLVHGFGENGDVFNRQVEFLKDDFKVIVPDLPGSGKSERLEGTPLLDDFADILKQIGDIESGSEQFHLFGHSMGGYTTMAFVANYESRLKSFGLIHSSAFADTDEKKESRRKAIDFIRDRGGQTFLKTIVPDLFSEETRERNPSYIDDLRSLAANISDEALVQYYNAMISRPNRSELLKTTHLPVLFLIGEFDKTVPAELSLKQSHLPKISSVNILKHSGHMGMWEETDATNQALKRFLDAFN